MIGTGYVGLVSGAGISDFGHTVICADIDQRKIQMLKKGEIPIYEPGLEDLVVRNVKAGRLSFATDVIGAIKYADAIFIAVGTPQAENGEADISAVEKVAKTIGKNLIGYKIVCTKSTVPIKTSRLITSIINSNKPLEAEYDYVSNPEFLREGSAVRDFFWPDRVIIGTISNRALAVMKDIYRPLYINETPIIHTNVQTAEMIKYTSNAFLALKISYINEIANFCDEVGADVKVVAKALGLDGRISPKFFHPGPGFGGSCFPKDTTALVAMAEKVGIAIRTIKAAIDTNFAQKERMIQKLKALLNGSFSNKVIAVLGLAFKPQTDDVRDSSSIHMIKGLLNGGAIVKAYDPIAPKSMMEYFSSIEYCDNWETAVTDVDAVVLMTEWNEFRGMDLKTLHKLMKSPVVLDTRNVFSLKELDHNGFVYDTVGRGKRIIN